MAISPLKWSKIEEKKLFSILASNKLLAALGSKIGTCLVFCYSFSVKDNQCTGTMWYMKHYYSKRNWINTLAWK